MTENMSPITDYYYTRAARVLAEIGAQADANPYDLTRAARAGYGLPRPVATRRGYIVTSKGRVVAHTQRQDNGGDYVKWVSADFDGRDIQDREAGLAMGAIKRQLGEDVVLVRWSQVGMGPGGAA